MRKQATRAAQAAVRPDRVGQMARLGYFAIGAVYLMIGLLALLGLFGVGAGQYTGSGGATRALLAQPFGRTLLGLIGAGLLTYVGWRVAQSFFDIEGRGRSTDGLLRRGGLALSAFSYAGLSIEIVRLFVTGGGGISDPKSDWTRALMSYPAGMVLIGLLGIAILGVAAVQLWMVYRTPFLRSLSVEGHTKRWVKRLGRLGFAARAVVFGLIGGFLLLAALRTDPSQAKGLGGALRTLARQSHGQFLIGVVALGLFSYGSFMFVKARFRQFASLPSKNDEASDRKEARAA